MIAALNLVVLIGIVRVFRDMRRGIYDESRARGAAARARLHVSLLRAHDRALEHTWQLFFVGFVFGIGFDTATEVLLLAGTARRGHRDFPGMRC